ncbi:MAG: hypothetical protein ACM3X5_01455 [Bacillota bacterium]
MDGTALGKYTIRAVIQRIGPNRYAIKADAMAVGDPPLPRFEETDWCEPCTYEEARKKAYLFIARVARAIGQLGHDVADVMVEEGDYPPTPRKRER